MRLLREDLAGARASRHKARSWLSCRRPAPESVGVSQFERESDSERRRKQARLEVSS